MTATFELELNHTNLPGMTTATAFRVMQLHVCCSRASCARKQQAMSHLEFEGRIALDLTQRRR